MMQESGVPEDGPLLGTHCWDTCSLASPDRHSGAEALLDQAGSVCVSWSSSNQKEADRCRLLQAPQLPPHVSGSELHQLPHRGGPGTPFPSLAVIPLCSSC